MAYAYGLARPAIAAIGVYSAPNPYQAFNDPCPQTPVTAKPTSDSVRGGALYALPGLDTKIPMSELARRREHGAGVRDRSCERDHSGDCGREAQHRRGPPPRWVASFPLSF